MTGSLDQTARVWNADGSGGTVVLKGHDSPILAVAFSATGERVVTGSVDHTARVWNADGTDQPIVLRGHSSPIDVVAFDPKSQRVITVSIEGDLKIWNLSTEALRKYLESANADCLLPGERAHYLEETSVQAGDRFALCERRHGREPSEAAP